MSKKVDRLYDLIKSSSMTLSEIQDRLAEIEIRWTKEQLQLFLTLAPDLQENGGVWKVKGNDRKDSILIAIGECLRSRSIIPLKVIQKYLNTEMDISATEEEILEIGINSGRYVTPNNKTLKRIEYEEK